MSWFLAPVYDRIVAPAEARSIGPWRSELLGALHGSVLEIGSGTGVNIRHYPAAVEHVTFTEPDPKMRRQLEAKLAAAQAEGAFAPAQAEVRTDSADALTVESHSVDHVVATLVLCTVPDPAAALAEARRVLKPGGSLVFIEHVAAQDRPDRLRWQRRIDPFWKRIAGGCRLIRATQEEIEAAGFEMATITRESARGMSPLLRATIRGVALAPTAG